jgi:hypothetical protein
LIPAAGSAIEPPRPRQEWFLKRAAFAEGRLWMLSDAGQLSSVGPTDDKRTEETLPEPPIDICQSRNALFAITCGHDNCTTWTLRKRALGKWSTEASVDTNHDELASVSCSAGGFTLLTSRRVIEISGGKVTSLTLSEPVGIGVIASVYADAQKLLLGVDAGEWGGGLQRIDRRTGAVTTIERNATGDLCDGPLNTACDPVNGIQEEPWQPGCVAAAIGLVHFSPHGRIVEVCGDKVRRLYFKPYGKDSANSPRRRKSDEPFETVAFFGLVRTGDALWAAGIDGLYRMEKGRVTETRPLPRFKDVGNISVSFAVPDLVLVITGINQRRSISGGVPMLIAR